MKDQKRLLNKCLVEDIPAFVICGSDICAVETMKAYYDVAKKNGCNKVFLDDMELVIREFEIFQKDEPDKVRIPD